MPTNSQQFDPAAVYEDPEAAAAILADLLGPLRTEYTLDELLLVELFLWANRVVGILELGSLRLCREFAKAKITLTGAEERSGTTVLIVAQQFAIIAGRWFDLRAGRYVKEPGIGLTHYAVWAGVASRQQLHKRLHAKEQTNA